LFSYLGLSIDESLFLLWLLAISAISLMLMGIDKAAAKLRKSRIRENTFAILSLFGGFAGVILGGLLFHHKTSKPRFWSPVAAALVLWFALYFLLFQIARL
jgi:uncharacterized membrane protein YsdA (DUF1294 family)